MRIIQSAKGTGKTEQLIDWLIENEGGELIVVTEIRRRQVVHRAIVKMKDAGDERSSAEIEAELRGRVFPIARYTREGRRSYRYVAVDDLDECLAYLIGRMPVLGALEVGMDEFPYLPV